MQWGVMSAPTLTHTNGYSMNIEQRIECESGKLLSRVTPDGIKFWCERHRREELRTWDEIDALRRSLMQVQIAISGHTTAIISQ